MFQSVHDILTKSSDFIGFNCIESSSIVQELVEDCSFEIAPPEVMVVAPGQVPKLLPPIPSYLLNDIGRCDAFRHEGEEKFEERVEEKEYNQEDDHKRGIELYINATPVPLSNDSPTTTSFPPSKEGRNDESKEQGDDFSEERSTKSDCKRKETVQRQQQERSTKADSRRKEMVRRQQQESPNSKIYYNVEVRDQCDNIIERRVTGIEGRGYTMSKSNTHSSSKSTTRKSRPRGRGLPKSSTKTTEVSKAKVIADTVRNMKNSYVQNEERKKLNWNDRLYQHGKRSVSARRQLDKVQHEERNKTAKFERKFQEMRKTSQPKSVNSKQRALKLYDLSWAKQVEGRLRRIEIMHIARKNVEGRSSIVFRSSSRTSKGCSLNSMTSSTDSVITCDLSNSSSTN